MILFLLGSWQASKRHGDCQELRRRPRRDLEIRRREVTQIQVVVVVMAVVVFLVVMVVVVEFCDLRLLRWIAAASI